MLPSTACRRYRNALIDFVDRRERGPQTPGALDHLARCERCESELAEYALTIVALRRAGREIVAMPVPARVRVRPRLGTLSGGERIRWRLRLGTMFTATALTALLVAPSLRPSSPDAGDTAAVVRTAAFDLTRRVESRVASFPDVPSYAAVTPTSAFDTDGRRPSGKEVPSVDAKPRAVRSL